MEGTQYTSGGSTPAATGDSAIARAVIAVAEGDPRPAVVLAGLDDVELVAAIRAMLRGKHCRR